MAAAPQPMQMELRAPHPAGIAALKVAPRHGIMSLEQEARRD